LSKDSCHFEKNDDDISNFLTNLIHDMIIENIRIYS